LKEKNVILDKSFQFSLRIAKLFEHLRERKVERALCSQLLRSGTTIVANI
jgi:four helix bundle protein